MTSKAKHRACILKHECWKCASRSHLRCPRIFVLDHVLCSKWFLQAISYPCLSIWAEEHHWEMPSQQMEPFWLPKTSACDYISCIWLLYHTQLLMRILTTRRWYWKFVQQRLPGWAPILTANGVIAYFAVTCVICIAIGVPVLIASLDIEQQSVRYDSLGPFTGSKDNKQQLLYAQGGSGVQVAGSITVTKTMNPPVSTLPTWIW